MKNQALAIGLVFVSAFSTRAAETSKGAGGIAVDESNFREIFSQSVEDVNESVTKESASFNLEVGVSYAGFSALELSNSFFTVDYARQIGGLPSIQISASKKFDLRGFGVEPIVAVGYGTRESLIEVTSRQNVVLRDYLSVHWLPLSAGARLSHVVPGVPTLTAFVTPSLGSLFFSQSGALDGMGQGFWIPNFMLRGGLSLFEAEAKLRSASAWLDGVTVSGAMIRGLSSANPMKAWSIDLGLRVLL